MLILALPFASAQAESPSAVPSGEELDEWTLLFYFCGSDLESKYGYASEDLSEIISTFYPLSIASQIAEESSIWSSELTSLPGRVNVLIETGGAKAWHSDMLGVEIDAGSVQRWRYDTDIDVLMQNEAYADSFQLVQTLPLQSMADPQTLSDFIRWGVKTCPAKKYALVLWGHGGGAGTGIFIDELFDGDILYLYELKQALADGGAHFETLVVDACLMANLETAWAVKDAASWMVASEETVPGTGTAISEWLQELISNPTCDGKWLSRCVCDTTGIKYANAPDDIAASLLTWSVIDLAKIDPLVEATGRYLSFIGSVMRRSPQMMYLYTGFFQDAEEYGDGMQDMRELANLVYDPLSVFFVDIGLRCDMLQALSDAVSYSLRGPGRSAARGLSFCYPADFDNEELDIYARNCPMPSYLAYLDAISPWSAPDSVYETVERLPEIDSIEEFRLKPCKQVDSSGMPGLSFELQSIGSILDSVYYRQYRLDEETGQIVRLGRTVCRNQTSDTDELVYRAGDPMHWPAIDGELICMDFIQASSTHRLYNVPAQISSESAILRCVRTITLDMDSNEQVSDYELLGVWVGFEEDNDLPGRSVKPLALIEGQEYRLLYPTEARSAGGHTVYQTSDTLTMYRAPEVKEIPLPPGTYYIEYEVTDIFMRSYILDRVEVRWDGAQMTFPDIDAWTGLTELH